MNLSIHVLDLTDLRPSAGGVPLLIERRVDEVWQPLRDVQTDEHARVEPHGIEPGAYRLTIFTAEYFGICGFESCYTLLEASFAFEARENDGDYHLVVKLGMHNVEVYRGG